MRVRCAILLSVLATVATAQLSAASPASSPGVPVIDTVAGNGKTGQSDGDGNARNAELAHPDWLTADGAGNVYFSDDGKSDFDHRIRKVDKAGKISMFAGNGDTVPPSDHGIPATEAKLYGPRDLATDKAGNLYVVDDRFPIDDPVRIYKVYSEGGRQLIRTIAGGGNIRPASGMIATEAKFWQLNSVAVGADGQVYVGSETQVWRFDPAGDNKLTLVAGTPSGGRYDPGSEGQPADSVAIGTPWGLAVDSTGKVYVGGDGDYGRLRVVGADKTIRTVACGGNAPMRDGIAALEADCEPMSIAVGPDDRPYFLGCAFYKPNRDCAKQRSYVATLDTDKKVINVVAGVPGKHGFSGDGGKATDAQLDLPRDLDVTASGDIYVNDRVNRRIRKVSRQAAPMAKDDAVTTDTGKAVMAEVLANDTGTALTITATTKPKHGTVTIAEDKKVIAYTPDAAFSGDDSFGYTVSDSVGQTATAKVTVTVKPASAPPAQPPGGGGNGGQPGPGQPVEPVAHVQQDGGLPLTGASVVGLVVAAGALLILGGGLVAFTARRRRSGRQRPSVRL